MLVGIIYNSTGQGSLITSDTADSAIILLSAVLFGKDDESYSGGSGSGGSGSHCSSADEESARGPEEGRHSAQVPHVHQLLQGRLREEDDSPGSWTYTRYSTAHEHNFFSCII